MKFYEAWWFQFIVAPLIVIAIAGFIKYFIWPKKQSNDVRHNNVGENQSSRGSIVKVAELGGDVVVGDKHEGDIIHGDKVGGDKITIRRESSIEKKIFVSPDTLPLYPHRNKEFTMKVTNNKDAPLYNIAVVLEIEGGDYSVNDIKHRILKPSQVGAIIGDETSKIKAHLEGFSFVGTPQGFDKNGQPWKEGLYIILESIDARGGTRDILVNIIGGDRNEQSTLNAIILGYGERPDKGPFVMTTFVKKEPYTPK